LGRGFEETEMRKLSNLPPNRKGCILRCECGFEIPVIPDIKAVGTAIDAHIEEHRKKHKDLEEGEEAAKHVHDYLFSELFDKLAEE
jgi:hypothetical protein